MDAVILYPEIGTRADPSSASGSLHAKAGDLKNAITGIGSKPIIQNGSAIKSVQRGTVILDENVASRTVTLSAVNVNKAMVNFLGAKSRSDHYVATSGNYAYAYTGYHFVCLSLSSPTSLNIEREQARSALTASYEVIEFY